MMMRHEMSVRKAKKHGHNIRHSGHHGNH
jgi:hypothetical protein